MTICGVYGHSPAPTAPLMTGALPARPCAASGGPGTGVGGGGGSAEQSVGTRTATSAARFGRGVDMDSSDFVVTMLTDRHGSVVFEPPWAIRASAAGRGSILRPCE